MHPTRPQRAKAGQRGAALLVTLVIVVMGIAAALVGSLSTTALKNARQETTSIALAQAKEALIGYAITYGDTYSGEVHGYLPCPDTSGSAEGSAAPPCGSKNVSRIGRLPWKTLGLPALRDGDGECLWYAISGTYKNNPKTDLMNWDNRGLFEVLDASGTLVAQDVVAVIFAPGPVLGSQNRAPNGTAPTCGGNYTATNYLDSDGTLNNGTVSTSANATSQFRLTSSTQINDRLIYITRQDLWNAMLKRTDFMTTLATMTRKAAECIADYGRRNDDGASDKRLPWSGRLLSPTTDYWTDSNYDDEDGRMAGRLPYRVNTSDSDSDNQIGSPHYQLASGSGCLGGSTWSTFYPWWTNWKDHLYYALAYRFRPSSGSTYCGTCLRVNGSGNYAAVVMFAGRPLAGQTRTTSSDRLNFGNYLEGRNYTYTNGSNPNPSGDSNYQSGAETGSFNDVVFCINPDLSVSPC